MWRVVKPNMRGGTVVIYANPRNVLAASLIGCDFLHLGIVLGDHQMAAHAELYAGDRRFRALISACMTKLTRQAFGYMRIVRKGDRLDGLPGMALKEIGDGFANGIVRRREDFLPL